jgi:hypothetical protein
MPAWAKRRAAMACLSDQAVVKAPHSQHSLPLAARYRWPFDLIGRVLPQIAQRDRSSECARPASPEVARAVAVIGLSGVINPNPDDDRSVA